MTGEQVKGLMREGVRGIQAWSAGRPVGELLAELGLTEIAPMGTNENPHGSSPLALAAMQEALRRANFYPDGSCTALRRKLARRHGVDEDMVLVGNGGDNCIHLLAEAFLNEGEEALMADPTFPVYETYVRAMGARAVLVPVKDHAHDLQAMSRRVGERTKLVFVCNPNNPTGTIVGKAELDAFVAALPAHVVLLLDEAYHEFVTDPRYPDGLAYVKAGHPVIVLRTFSKLYGLAGLRVGYLIADRRLLDAAARVREPYAVTTVSEAAAVAALDDADFVAGVLRENERSKRLLSEGFQRLGLPHVPTQTNFVLVDTGRDAGAVSQALLKRGYLVRPGTAYRLPSWLRVTFGTEAHNRGFLEALEQVLTEVRPVAGH